MGIKRENIKYLVKDKTSKYKLSLHQINIVIMSKEVSGNKHD